MPISALSGSASSISSVYWSLKNRFVFRNVRLQDVDITGGSIIASNISLPLPNGVVTMANGNLVVASSIEIDGKGRLVLRDVNNPIDFHANVLKNVNIQSATLRDITSASIDSLHLSLLEPHSFLSIDSTRAVVAVRGMAFAKGELKVEKLGGFTLTGPVDLTGQLMSNIAVSSGYATNLDIMSARHIRLLSSSKEYLLTDTSLHLLTMNWKGDLAPLATDDCLNMGNLGIKSILMNGSIDLNGFRIGNVSIFNAEEGSINRLRVTSLSLASLPPLCAPPSSCFLLGVDNEDHEMTGSLRRIELEPLLQSIYTKMSDLDHISVNGLRFKGTAGVSGALAVDDIGEVKSTQTLKLDTVHTNSINAISITTSSLQLRDMELLSSPLGTDESGNIVGLNNTNLVSLSIEDRLNVSGALNARTLVISEFASEDEGAIQGVLTATSSGQLERVSDVAIHDLKATFIATDFIVADEIRLKSALPADQRVGVLSVDAEGMVTPSEDLNARSLSALDAKFETVVAGAMSLSDALTARILHVHDLTAEGSINLLNDVVIHGSISVDGSVIGSGPYVDSSDGRLKTNVQPLFSALDKVCALQGVRFKFLLPFFSLICSK